MTRGSAGVCFATVGAFAVSLTTVEAAGAGTEGGIGISEAGLAYDGVSPEGVTGWEDDLTIADVTEYETFTDHPVGNDDVVQFPLVP